MRLWLLLCGALLALFALAAEAGMKAGPNVMPDGHHRLRAGGVAPPLDGLTAASEAYSFRRLRSAYAGNAVKLRRASDSTVLDIGFAGNDFDSAAAATFCASTSCFIDTWYDQGPGARSVVQAVLANQLAYIAGCIGTKSCMQSTNSNVIRLLTAGSFASATGLLSASYVGNRTAGTTSYCQWLMPYGGTPNWIAANAAANQWFLYGGTGGTVVGVANDNVWHAGQGVINGASSVLNIDGVETTGNVTGNTNTGQLAVGASGATLTCRMAEGIHWDNYALTSAERAALVANQRAYWGF